MELFKVGGQKIKEEKKSKQVILDAGFLKFYLAL